MSHLLKMAIVQSIIQLHSLGWSQRRIARELGIHRETVGKYLKEHLCGSEPAISPPGSEQSKPASLDHFPGPASDQSDSVSFADSDASSKPAISPSGSRATTVRSSMPSNAGRRSDCEPYRDLILEKLKEGLSAQRIYQDLQSDEGWEGSYDSVKRFVRKLGRVHEFPMRRIEVEPGQEAQVDFGTGAPVIMADGKRRKTHVFRVVLSHSRKGYSEATFRQTTDDFIGCLENSFLHFRGVPRTVVIDNLKAAVKRPDWFDPELVPKLEAFCRHYQCVILPTRPRMPRHKGKVERGIDYVQENGLKGHRFESLQAQNEHLLKWESQVADTRIHGSTCKQVARAFIEVEQHALLPLPTERFPDFQEGQRKVSRDGHIEVAKAYYSAPPEYLGRTIWVRWDRHLVRLFSSSMELIAVHARHQPGAFSTLPAHIASEKIHGIERGVDYLLRKVEAIGSPAHQWAQAMLTSRGIQGVRVLQGLLSLANKHDSRSINRACEIALSYGEFRVQTVRRLIGKQAPEQQTFDFIEEHPIIRPLDAYGEVVAKAFARERTGQSPDSHSGMRFGRHDRAKESPSAVHEKRPGSQSSQGAAEILPPRSGYPSSSCSPAEPDSVSPDSSSVVRIDSVPTISEEKKDE